jgi:uncharacterized membrane-anchored protein
MPDPTLTVDAANRRLDGIVAWIKGHERMILIVTVALQFVLLVSMIGVRSAPLLMGESILVRVQPVDPRDMFRGDFVTLSYQFSRVPATGIEGLSPVNNSRQEEWAGRTVYVTLGPEPDGKHWRAEHFSIFKPSGGKFLRGSIGRFGMIEYGIESYFVQEGQGKKYEEAIGSRRLSAEIVVNSDGNAALRRLVIE